MAYDKITLYPGVKYDYLIFLQDRITQAQLDRVNDPFYLPSWGDFDWDDPLIIATFTNGIDSSIIDGLLEPAIGWRVYRRKLGETVSHFVAEVPELQFFLKDYNVANRTDYVYDIMILTENEMGLSMRTNDVYTDWRNWSITGLEQIGDNVFRPTKVWLFDLNLTSMEILQNIDFMSFNTFTKYPKVAKGKLNYQTISFTALIGGMACSGERYREPIEILQAWQEFVGSSNLVILKDIKGQIKLGHINLGSTAKYIEQILYDEVPTQIMFQFIETQDITDSRIYTAEGKEQNYVNVQKKADNDIFIPGFDEPTGGGELPINRDNQIVVDNRTITGRGTEASPLRLNISGRTYNTINVIDNNGVYSPREVVMFDTAPTDAQIAALPEGTLIIVADE